MIGAKVINTAEWVRILARGRELRGDPLKDRLFATIRVLGAQEEVGPLSCEDNGAIENRQEVKGSSP
jgi:hypothetical protein